MALTKTKRCKIDRTPVYLDFAGVKKILANRGIKKEVKDQSEDIGFSTVSIHKWQKEAPEVVTMLFHYLKDNMLTFEDFVKLCEPTVKK